MRRKKNKGVVLLIILFVLTGIKYWGNQKEDIETVQNVTESTLVDFERTKSAIEKKASTEHWLDKIEQSLQYKAWYCGHWHTDKRIDKFHFLYHSFESDEWLHPETEVSHEESFAQNQ